MLKKTLLLIVGLIAGAAAAQTPFQSNISLAGPRNTAIEFDAYNRIFYVSAVTGSDKTGDGSRDAPFQTIIFALSKLDHASMDSRAALLVAAGRYTERTIPMQPHVDLFGGFCPENWERDLFKYRTILDGEHVRRVVLGGDHACIDGFVITNGVARYHGAGILCDDNSPTISNNYIINNMTLEPEDFKYDRMYQQGHHGGGIACLYNSVPVIVNNYIAGNKTSVGLGAGVAFYGFLRIDGSEDPVLKEDHLEGGLRAVCENNVFIGNTAGVNDLLRSRSSSGGAIVCAVEARPIIRNNVIAGNRAKGRSDAGGIYCEYWSYPDIIGNWIVGNVSDDDGGAIYTMRLGQPLIEDNFIAGNWTTGGGNGGVRLSKEGRAVIRRNRIVHNLTGGGVQCIDSYMRLEDNVIMHNRGVGLSFHQNFQYFPGCEVHGNIIRENEGNEIDIRVSLGKSLIVENNNIEGGYTGEGNVDEPVDLKCADLNGLIVKSRIDEAMKTTTLYTRKKLAPTGLAGRVIRIGDTWSVIREARGKTLTVWGVWKLPNDAKQSFTILATYQ